MLQRVDTEERLVFIAQDAAVMEQWREAGNWFDIYIKGDADD